MEKWRADLMADKDQSRQLINPRGTMKGRILIPLRTIEKDQLTLLIRLVGPMKGKILQNAFKSSSEYCRASVGLHKILPPKPTSHKITSSTFN